MRHFYLLVLLLIGSYTAFAQPVNDECSGIIDLGTAPFCNEAFYTNVDATSSDYGNLPDCFNSTPDRDVWFSFVASDTIIDYVITLTGITDGNGSIPMTNPEIAIYRGDCEVDGLAENDCGSAVAASNSIQIDVNGLTPGATYFIRVNDYSENLNPNWGTFQLCVEAVIPSMNINEIDESSACSGTLFDSGGPDGDYSDNEFESVLICPNETNQCIEIDLVDYDIENNFDFLNIYAGTDNTAPAIATLTGVLTGDDFKIQTSSSCIYIEFSSDGSQVQGGFELTWNCTQTPCSASSVNNPTVINAIPYDEDNESTCNDASTIAESACANDQFLSGPDYFYTYDSPGGECLAITITDAELGTGVIIMDGPPDDPATMCIATGSSGVIPNANLMEAGTYYIVVANPNGCTDFEILIEETECILNIAGSCEDAINLSDCDTELPNIFFFENGVGDEDFPTQGENTECIFGTGAEPDIVWFEVTTVEAGEFGFVLGAANPADASDIDFAVWGPFEPDDEDMCMTILNQFPIRESYTGSQIFIDPLDQTGLASQTPGGLPVEDEIDCQGTNDAWVRPIDVLPGERYIVWVNDWGNNITEAGISIDFGPTTPGVIGADLFNNIVFNGDTTICPGDAVQLEVINALQLEWSPAESLSCDNCPNPIATPSESTTYQVVAQGACSGGTAEIEVLVYNLDAGPDRTVCIGESFELVVGAELENANYSWMPSTGLSCDDCPNPIITALGPGPIEYIVSLNAPDCSFTDTMVLNVLDFTAPVYEAIPDTAICVGTSIDLGFPTNDPSNTYTWTSSAMDFNSNNENPNVTPDSSLIYYVAVENGICPVPSLDSIIVTVDTLPILNVANDTSFCQNESMVMGNTEVIEDFVYSWSPVDGLVDASDPNTIATPSESTNYVLTATNGACVSTASVNVDITEINVVINADDSLRMCTVLGDSELLTTTTSPDNLDVNWTASDGSLSVTADDIVATPSTTVSYYATVEVPGCLVVDTVFLRVDSIPLNMEIMPADTTICEGSQVQLLSTTFDPIFWPEITHQWISDPEFHQFLTPDSFYNLVVQPVDTATYYRISTNGVCIDTAMAVVNVAPTTEITITPMDTTVCSGEMIQFLATSPDVTEFTWMGSNLSCEMCPDPIVDATSSGDYTVEGEFEDCPVSASTSLTVVPTPFALPNNTTYCPGAAEVGLNNAPDFSVVSGATYEWTSPDDPSFSSNIFNPTVAPDVTTTYNLTLTGPCGIETFEVNVAVAAEAIVMVNEDITICEGESTNLEAIGNSIGSYQWSDGQSGENISVSPTTETTYTVTFDNGCDVGTAEVTVFVDPDFDIDITSSPSADSTIYQGQNVTLVTEIITPVPPGTPSYAWSGPDPILSPAQPTTIVSPPNEGSNVYSVSVTIGECTNTASIDINAERPQVDIANAFTPDGDGLNDDFGLIFIDGTVENFSLRIWNRWGDLVFETTNPDEAWDGRNNGKLLPSDVYVFTTTYTIVGTSLSMTKEGDVTLIR